MRDIRVLDHSVELVGILFRSNLVSRFCLFLRQTLWFLLLTWNVLLLIVMVIHKFPLQSINDDHSQTCFTFFVKRSR